MNPTDKDSEVRFWYSGKTPPSADLATAAERAAVRTETMYAQSGERRSGPYAEVMEKLLKAMQGLQRNAYPLAADTMESRVQQFAGALVDFTETPAQRVQVLKQLGTFRFRKADSAEVRKEKLGAALKALEEGEADGAEEIWQIWRPEAKSLIDSIINRPSDVGRIIVRRIQGRDDRPLNVVVHRFNGIDADMVKPFIQSRAVAYQRNDSIHLLGDIGEYLMNSNGTADDSDDTLTQLHILLLHELLEGVLHESTELDAVAAHIVAATCERCLADKTLPIAVELFFTEWESQPDDGDPMLVEAASGETGVDEADDDGTGQLWADCIVAHDELSPEAFEERTTADQKQ